MLSTVVENEIEMLSSTDLNNKQERDLPHLPFPFPLTHMRSEARVPRL